MTDFTPELIADSFVSLAGLIGLMLFSQVLRHQRPRPAVTQWFLFALNVVMAVMAARILQWFTGWDWVGRLTFIFASLVPLASLLVTEALLRRHAPGWLKFWTAGGAVVLFLVAMLVGNEHAGRAVLLLAMFQCLTFLALAAIVVLRDRQALSRSENRMIDRLSLSLGVILPFALSDFRTEDLNAPVRMSGIAILALCWLALSLRREESLRHRFILNAFVWALGILAVSLTIATLAGLGFRQTVQVMAVVISAGLLAVVFGQVRKIRQEDGQGALLEVLANTQHDDHAGFLRALQTGTRTLGALVIDADSLGDFDDAFCRSFHRHPIVTAASLPQIDDPGLIEQFDWFFRKFAASHAMMVSEHPFQIMALHVPELAQSKRLDQELQIAQRIAVMLAKREAQT